MKRSFLIFIITLTMTATAFAQRGGGLPPPPALTGPVADLVQGIINAINKQDTAYIQKIVAPDAIWADEDGHILPARFFIGKLMQGKASEETDGDEYRLARPGMAARGLLSITRLMKRWRTAARTRSRERTP